MSTNNYQLWENVKITHHTNSIADNNANMTEDLAEAFQLLDMTYQPSYSKTDKIDVYTNCWADKLGRINTVIATVTDKDVEVSCKYNNRTDKTQSFDYKKPKSLANMVMFTENFYNAHDYVLSFNYLIVEKDVITASRNRSNRRNTDQRQKVQDLLVRCRSSNVWAYGMNIKDRKSGVGDLYLQFKGDRGRPGDIYIYYDVPVKVYRRLISAPSKGHFMWTSIRDVYRYSKLTGDRRGKLRNAIN